MKPRHTLAVLMLFACLCIFGQQSKTIPMQGQPQKTSTQVATNQQELILQLQAENEAMQKQLEKMEKEIELYRGDVRTKISELDYAQDRWLTMLTIIMGLIGVILGVGAPLFINRDNSKRLETRFSEMKEDLGDQVQTATDQAMTATNHASKAKESFEEIQSQIKLVKEQVTSATEQVKVAAEQAKKAEEASTQMQMQVRSVAEQVDSATAQAMVATEQAKQAKQAVTEIEDLKKHVTTIEEKINKDAIAAEKAANEAKASQLFTQALNEKIPLKAIGLYSKAIELKPDYADAYHYRGYEKDTLKDKEGALEDYDKAIALNPNDSDLYNNRAYTLLTIGKLSKALDDVNIAIEMKKDGCYYDTRGQIYMAMDNNIEALKDFDNALSLNNKYREALVNRAQCYRKLAEVEQNPAKKADLVAKAEDDEKKAEALKKEDKFWR